MFGTTLGFPFLWLSYDWLPTVAKLANTTASSYTKLALKFLKILLYKSGTSKQSIQFLFVFFCFFKNFNKSGHFGPKCVTLL